MSTAESWVGPYELSQIGSEAEKGILASAAKAVGKAAGLTKSKKPAKKAKKAKVAKKSSKKIAKAPKAVKKPTNKIAVKSVKSKNPTAKKITKPMKKPIAGLSDVCESYLLHRDFFASK